MKFKKGDRVKFMALVDDDGKPYGIAPDSDRTVPVVATIATVVFGMYAVRLDDGSPFGLPIAEESLEEA